MDPEAQLNDEQLNEPNETQEGTTEENNEEAPKAPKREAQVAKAQVKTVKVRLREDVNCYIGGKHYLFGADKEALVPEDVAAVLTNAHKAYRI